MNNKILFMCTAILLTPVLMYAETMYVTDILEVAVRTGKGVEFKILAIAKSNEKVDVLSTEGEYANVRLENDVEGWILRRYLAGATPKPLVISNLQAKIEKLQKKSNNSAEKTRKLRGEKAGLEKTQKMQKKKIETLENDYVNLKAACSDYIKLRDDYERLEKEVTSSKRRMSQVTLENAALQNKSNLMWFGAGSSAVLIGFIIGLVLQNFRYKRKRQIRF